MLIFTSKGNKPHVLPRQPPPQTFWFLAELRRRACRGRELSGSPNSTAIARARAMNSAASVQARAAAVRARATSFVATRAPSRPRMGVVPTYEYKCRWR
ncbi:hypothetical protein GQ55_5G289600 [Panicum hallii var. hallii]|uniref:Uncharacterized protein n=1 Tax=Panicum hallii var. hallii TaxID=1504633 RepID=A0A2T7DLA3_9POAL|nr:hypothetical protein GQ55_5G289600 [Panicum hallii var. hallii]